MIEPFEYIGKPHTYGAHSKTSNPAELSPPAGFSTNTTCFINTPNLKNPTKYFYIADSYRDSDNSQLYLLFTFDGSGSRGYVHLRHGAGANTLFADGHVNNLGPSELYDIGLLGGYAGDGSLMPF
jgi:prepilin-type processing-associated H-X9-DG protein